MTYSCSDFTDAILNKCADLGWIDGERIPADHPEAQADLVLDAIERIRSDVERLATAARKIIQARDYHAEFGHYPKSAGIAKDQDYDDWAADLCEAALRASGRRVPTRSNGKPEKSAGAPSS